MKHITALAAKAGTQISDNVARIEVLGDMSGVYSDISTEGAVETDGGKVAEMPIGIVSADHQNKADVVSCTARKWFDIDKVDMITDLTNSAAALAVSQIDKEKDKAILVSRTGVTAPAGKACTATTVRWTYDTTAISKAVTLPLLRAGLKSWYFLAPDYVFATSMQRDAPRFIENAGGAMLGLIRHPLGALDFSSFLLTAQASKAQVVALANSGGGLQASIKQAAEFGIGKSGRCLAGLLVTLLGVHSMGLDKGHDLAVTTPFYWDKDEKTPAFTVAFVKRTGGKHPRMRHSGLYASVLHYLKAEEAAKTDAGASVVAKTKELTIDDPLLVKAPFGKMAARCIQCMSTK